MLNDFTVLGIDWKYGISLELYDSSRIVPSWADIRNRADLKIEVMHERNAHTFESFILAGNIQNLPTCLQIHDVAVAVARTAFLSSPCQPCVKMCNFGKYPGIVQNRAFGTDLAVNGSKSWHLWNLNIWQIFLEYSIWPRPEQNSTNLHKSDKIAE